MSNVDKEALVQLAVMGLHLVFTNLKLAGKTTEEIDRIFQAEKLKFEKRKPQDLPDV